MNKSIFLQGFLPHPDPLPLGEGVIVRVSEGQMAILLPMENNFFIFWGVKTLKRPSPTLTGALWAWKPRPYGMNFSDSHRKVRQSEHTIHIVIIIFDFFRTVSTNGEGREVHNVH